MRILAALSHSPGREKDCIRLEPPAIARELPSYNISQTTSMCAGEYAVVVAELVSQRKQEARIGAWESVDTYLREGASLLPNIGCLSFNLVKEVGEAWHRGRR